MVFPGLRDPCRTSSPAQRLRGSHIFLASNDLFSPRPGDDAPVIGSLIPRRHSTRYFFFQYSASSTGVPVILSFVFLDIPQSIVAMLVHAKGVQWAPCLILFESGRGFCVT